MGTYVISHPLKTSSCCLPLDSTSTVLSWDTHSQNVIGLVGKRADRVDVERDLRAGHGGGSGCFEGGSYYNVMGDESMRGSRYLLFFMFAIREVGSLLYRSPISAGKEVAAEHSTEV
jgi:hypothetical protein